MGPCAEICEAGPFGGPNGSLRERVSAREATVKSLKLARFSDRLAAVLLVGVLGAAGRVLAAAGDEADAVPLVLERCAEVLPAAVYALGLAGGSGDDISYGSLNVLGRRTL